MMIYLVTKQIYLFESELFKIIPIEEAIKLLDTFEEIGVDTETQGLDSYTKKLLLLQLGNFDTQIVIDINSYNNIIPVEFKNYLNNSKKLYILQNAKFDLKFLFQQNIILTKIYDTMLAETILTNGLQYSGRDLQTLVKKYCDVYLDKSERGNIIKNGLTDASLIYGANDVKYLPKIKELQLIKAKELNLINAINLDNAFVVPLAYTEFCGIKLDLNKWLIRTSKNKEEARKLKILLEEKLLEDKKFKYFSGMQDMFTGEQECLINWDSPKQVLELFKEYGIKVTIKDKGEDKETINANILSPQKKNFPILEPYLNYKEKQKDITTYGASWAKHINPVTGRVHTTFQQLMDTGRLSSGNKRDGTPNLQNIPAEEEARNCFISEELNVMVDADYSSQEQIILANVSKEENLLNFYKKGFSDMHSYVAFLMYPHIRKCSLEELTPEELKYIPKEHGEKRKLAKNAGFAINYGGNGSTIAKNCNISAKDGEFVYKSYFEAFPGLKNYFELMAARTFHFGYVQFNNITGRKYFFDKENNDYFALKDIVEDKFFWHNNPNAKEIMRNYNKAKSDIQRLSQNYPIQGTASDITKYACIIFFREILKRNWWLKVKIVNLIHDEILVECSKELVAEVKSVLIDSMEQAGKPFCLIVSLKADAKEGDHWVH